MKKESRPPSSADGGPTADEVFRRFWIDVLYPAPGAKELKDGVDSLIRAPQLTPAMRKQTFAQYRDAIRASLGEGTDLILYGSLKSLERQGECVSVQYAGLLTSGVSACVDPAAGRVVFVCITPEG